MLFEKSRDLLINFNYFSKLYGKMISLLTKVQQPMNSVHIRRISVSDVSSLRQLAITTYQNTFKDSNTDANMKAYLQNGFSIEKLTQEIQNENSEFYFAELDQQHIGYLKINYGKAQTEFKNEDSLEIERIYVLKEYHGKGIGQELFNYALKRAKNREVKYVWLGVWEHNPRAISFYEKNGLEVFDQHPFKMGDDIQTDLLRV